MKYVLVAALLALAFCNAADYSEHGANWADIVGDELCGTGQEQSPINFYADADYTAATGFEIKFEELKRVSGPMTYEDHQVKWAEEDEANDSGMTTITKVDGTTTDYDFLQMHFHAPSEHTVDGKYYDAELHLVH